MKVFRYSFLAIFLFAGIVYAKDEIYREAERFLVAGDYTKAEDLLNELISTKPKNASHHRLLGDVYMREGRLEEALSEYKESKRLGGESPELLKRIAAVEKRARNFDDAEKADEGPIQLNPRDEEAKTGTKALMLKRGLGLRATIGGWEADHTLKGYEGMLSYSGIDKLDLYAGYGYADQIYYTRRKVYAKGYYFYNANSYVKLELTYKNYDYPVDPAAQKPNPDSSSYHAVPIIELEVSHWFIKSVKGSLAYEYFKPNFFYDKENHANIYKVSAELYYITPYEPLRLKVMYAVLSDPDPKMTTIKGRPAAAPAHSTDVVYQTQSLLGGAVEFVKGGLSAELKYMPNRDLDRSYEYSILAGLGCDFTERITCRFDYVYDKYSTVSIYSGKTAHVYVASIFYKLSPSIDLGAGYKFIDRARIDATTGSAVQKQDHTGFLTLSFKTGLGT